MTKSTVEKVYIIGYKKVWRFLVGFNLRVNIREMLVLYQGKY